MNVKSGKCDLKYHLLLFIAVNAFPVNVIRFPLPLTHGGFTKSTTLTLLQTVLSAALPRWQTDLETVQIKRQVDVFLSCSTPSITGDNPIRPSPTASSWQYQRHGEWRRLSPPPSETSVRRTGESHQSRLTGCCYFSAFYLDTWNHNSQSHQFKGSALFLDGNKRTFFFPHPQVNPSLNQLVLSSFLFCFFLR